MIQSCDHVLEKWAHGVLDEFEPLARVKLNHDWEMRQKKLYNRGLLGVVS